MSPYLLLGFLIAGLLHVYIPGKYYTRYLAKPTFRSVINAALFGIPLPLCSCGVIPTAMSLRKEGASKGSVVSFLIATPQTGVDSIMATYSLLGLPFAIIRPVVAFVTSLFGGWLTNLFTKHESNETPSAEEHHHCCCHKEEDKPKEHCCCHEEQPTKTTEGKLTAALRYAYISMMEDIGKWLIIGLVIAAVIAVVIPDSFFAIFKDNTLLSMLLVLLISIPMYTCATSSIPVAVALMMKGLTPGAALVLLMAGPAANMASLLIIRNRLGIKALIAYLAAIVGGAIAFGLCMDYLLPREWFTYAINETMNCCHEHTSSWFQWGCTILLALMLVNALVIQRFKTKTHGHE